MSTVNWAIDQLIVGQIGNEVTLNRALDRVDALLNNRALGIDLLANLPVGTLGTVYLVNDPGFSGVAIGTGSGYDVIVPNAGARFRVDGDVHTFDGTAWISTSQRDRSFLNLQSSGIPQQDVPLDLEFNAGVIDTFGIGMNALTITLPASIFYILQFEISTISLTELRVFDNSILLLNLEANGLRSFPLVYKPVGSLRVEITSKSTTNPSIIGTLDIGRVY